MPVFPVDLYFLWNYQEETMESKKKTFVKSLRRLIFCIIVALLFGRSTAFCRGSDEFEDLAYATDRSFASAQLPEGLTLEVLANHKQALPSPLASAKPDSLRSVPVPPAGVTAGVCAAAMVVGWLRRRTPSELTR
jgi:hypothetical protein